MKSVIRRLLCAAAALAAVHCGARAVVVNFENLNPGAGVLNVTNQYASVGLTFNSPVCIDFSQHYPTIAGFAHSGTKAVEQCFAAEFCSSPIQMNFTAAQARVKCWVGFDSALSSPLQVALIGYDSGGNQVAEDTVTLPVSSAPIPCQLPLEIGTVSSRIVRAEVSIPGGFTNGLAVDDVEFDTVGPPPPCTATQNPTVHISSPTGGTTTSNNRFLYTDAATSQDPFATRTVTVTGPAGQSQQYQTSAFGTTTTNTWVYEMLFPGLNSIKTVVQDCRGTAVSSTSITYTPLPADTGFNVLGWEITQSIQNVQQSVPLIAEKRTYLRVYLQVTGTPTSVAGVSGTLNANWADDDPQWHLGRSVAPYNLKSLNTLTVDNLDNVDNKRNLFTRSLNFELPHEWTVPERVHFTLALNVEDVASTVPCQDCNFQLAEGQYRYVTFLDVPAITVHVVDIPYHDKNSATPVFAPNDNDHTHLKSWLQRAYPVSDVELDSATTGVMPVAPGQTFPPASPNSFPLTFDAGTMNNFLSSMRDMDESDGLISEQTRYYGMVNDAGGFMRGQADSIPSRVASGPTGNPVGTGFGWDTDNTYGDWYGGHELGHTFGRTHAEFCGAEACPEIVSYFCPGGYQPYPYPAGALSGGPFPLYYGFDAGDASINLAPAIYNPSTYTDIMTYCDYEWMSDFTYERILNEIQSEFPQSRPEAPRRAATGIIVTGELNLTQGTGVIRPAWKLDNLITSTLPDSSHYAIFFRDASGVVLAQYLFNPNVDTEVQSGEDVKATVSEVLPWVAGTRTIAISRDGVDLVAVPVSPNSPVVHITTPNGGENFTAARAVNVAWQASDADGDPLTYTLQYSPDDGATWRALATNITDTSYLAPISELIGSTQALFRVTASDGVNTGSDTCDAVFTMPNHAPQANIIAPATGSAFNSNQTVAFTGEARDVEDGALQGTSLTWSSSIQGVLGTGKFLSAQLKPGTHTITLTATDSAGVTSPAVTIVVTVAASAPIANPGATRMVLVGQTVTMDGSASEGFAPIAYSWKLVQRPVGSAAQLTNATSAAPSFTADIVGTYQLQLVVTDATGFSAMAPVTIIASSVTSALRIAGGLQAATTADMTNLNVITSAPSTYVIDLMDVLRLLQRTNISRQGYGVVTRSATNSYSTYGVLIDDPNLNGWPDVPMVVGHIFASTATAELGVQYLPSAGKWLIYTEDHTAMANGENFAYVYGPSVHTITRSASNAPFAWDVRLNDPALNQNPNAIVLATHNLVSVTNPSPVGLWYDGAEWNAYNEGGEAMTNGERFFTVDATGSGGRIVLTTSNAGPTGVQLTDTLLNSNPSAVVIAQHAAQSQYNSAPMCTQYSTKFKKWIAFNEDKSPLRVGEAVDYMILSH